MLGKIEMVPVMPDIGRPYYQARSSVGVLDLLKTRPNGRGHENGPDRTRGAAQGHEDCSPDSYRQWTCATPCAMAF